MDLTFAHFIALLPLLVTTGTAIAVMLLIAWKRNHRIAYIASVAGLLLALLSIQPALEAAPLDVTALLRMDAFGYFYTALLLVATLTCITLAHATWVASRAKAASPATARSSTC